MSFGTVHICGPTFKPESFKPCGCPVWSYFDFMEMHYGGKPPRGVKKVSKTCSKGHRYDTYEGNAK